MIYMMLTGPAFPSMAVLVSSVVTPTWHVYGASLVTSLRILRPAPPPPAFFPPHPQICPLLSCMCETTPSIPRKDDVAGI